MGPSVAENRHRWDLAGLSTVLHKLLSDKLRNVEAVCINSTQVMERLTSRTFDERVAFLKIDVRDFFMDGSHDVLAKVVGSFFEGTQRDWVVDCIYHVLFYQVVTDGDDLWAVERGSGMGSIHSSSLADLAFHGLVERGWNMKEDGAEMVVRFRDDLLVILRTPAHARPFFNEMEKRAKPCWRLKIEKCSLVAAEMLDIDYA